ncbi:MAG: NAD(P)H-dependent flavin oxidoreductase [Hyphomicrobiaceae bacterium]
MALRTRLTEHFAIEHPVLQAPMAFAAGGALAAAVSNAGGLGFVGGGYGDEAWLKTEVRAAGNARVGIGFITWKVMRDAPHLIDQALTHKPAALFLSFGAADRAAAQAKAAGIPLVLQVQTRHDAEEAIKLGADVIVAQGAEAGGHGENRAVMTLVPEVADLIQASAPDTLLCAAGGIADGRGLAAALALGADGVVVGTRFWASREARVHRNQLAAALEATGDDTVRQSVTDIARGYDWPTRFNIRVVRNAYIEQWRTREPELKQAGEAEQARYAAAVERGDPTIAAAIAGEAVGLIRDVKPAAEIVRDLVADAERVLQRLARLALD